MAVSASTNFVITRDDVIQEALEQIGYLSVEESPTANDLTSCTRTLNMMVKAWQGRGLNIFRLKASALFLSKDTNDYTLGGSSSDRWGYAYGFTALNGAQAASATAMTVDSITGMVASDKIGIKLADGTMHWDVISGTPTGTTATLTTGLASAALDNAVVYFYTATTELPMRVIHMLHRNSGGTETPGHVWESYEYVSLPNKTSDGIALQGWFDRQQAAPVWHVWPQENVADSAHILYVQNQVDDFDSATDDADYPQEWYWALSLGLAKALIPKFGVPYTTAREITMQAEDALMEAEGFDRGETIMFQPNLRDISG